MLAKLNNNPIMRIEAARIRSTKFHWLLHVRWLFPLFIFASIPLRIYLDPTRRNLLFFMFLMLYSTQFILTAYTALIASDTFTRLRRLQGNGDLLVLTGIDAHRFVMGVWWSVIRRVWLSTSSSVCCA